MFKQCQQPLTVIDDTQLNHVLALYDKGRSGLHASQRGQLIGASQTLIHRIATPGIPEVFTSDTLDIEHGVDAVLTFKLTGLLKQDIGVTMKVQTAQHAQGME